MKRTPGREEVKEESLWEESENILRRIEGDSAQEDSTGCHSFCKDTCHLQLEIEELKQKLWEKDCLLQTMGQPSNQALEVHTSQVLEEKPWEKDSVHQRNGNWHYTSSQQMNLERNDSQYDALENDSPAGLKNGSKDLKVEDMVLLKSQVEKLRQELCEKDRYIQSAQLELHEQQVHQSPLVTHHSIVKVAKCSLGFLVTLECTLIHAHLEILHILSLSQYIPVSQIASLIGIWEVLG